ncbi:BirA family biotin operon repressor/biotin-[acetyl-CoA-carboxylase] ligase [Microbacterium sp. BE35]|uniref:biotin--[acetyl-CoA-carboxylase] ligase n=1 Tax=Microbacterium sp. BE35 TaxID=2817773 RepID=UPI0028645D6F|nr:biotin--[acetyl-CoA-carboxylase] ligase [Microbacterium sp. BE35]MDR7189089.1 BirA family biotin operon repressor/biotin-[acetyl-CoA-carboxylase] ligase [Microbacterium sp. BE35]
MTFSSEGFPLTAARSPRVQVVETTDSTNADVIRHVIDAPDEWPHLSLLLTNDQRAGRGRLDRTWVTPPGSALAVSVAVDASALPVAAGGWIPLIAGAAMTRAIAAQLVGSVHSATLKWPNDVLLDGSKICGILAEVVPEHPDVVVIGSGVNTRMAAVDLPVATATSFAAAGLVCDDDRLLADYLGALDEQLKALGAAGGDAAASGVLGEVESLCSTLGSDVAVSLPNGETLWGRAQRIDPDGRLVVVQDAEFESVVSAGDVVHVRSRPVAE